MSKFFMRLSVTIVIFYSAVGTVWAADHYHDFNTMTARLKDLAKQYPEIIRLESTGTTMGNRQVWCTIISAGAAEDKPAILIVGAAEGVDLVASDICLQLIHDLVSQYGKVDSVTRQLDQMTFYIFPRVNPDATEAFFNNKLKYEKSNNDRPVDQDKDGLIDEDGYDDLNGDGLITMMRVTDPAGDWLPDPEIPELLRKADRSKGEKGIFSLYPEGLDNDGDGKWNEDEPGGVNFNRNFPYQYKFFEKGSGVHPVSEVETRAVADFAFAHPNITMVFSFSPNHNLLTPWQTQSSSKESSVPARRERFESAPLTSVLPKDAEYFNQISKKFKEITKLSDAFDPEKHGGVFGDWAYYHFGRWAFSAPAWWPPIKKDKADTNKVKEDRSARMKKDSDSKKLAKDPLAAERRLWHWLQATGQTGGFVPWTACSHPDFPGQKVEIGGFQPYIGINPLADSLALLAKKYNDFVRYLGTLLPKIKIGPTDVDHLHDNVYRIRSFISNTGYLPTQAEIGEWVQWCPRVKVSLKLTKDQKLASGKQLSLLAAIPGSNSSVELSWIIMGKKGTKVTISAGSPMTGTDERVIALE